MKKQPKIIKSQQKNSKTSKTLPFRIENVQEFLHLQHHH